MGAHDTAAQRRLPLPRRPGKGGAKGGHAIAAAASLGQPRLPAAAPPARQQQRVEQLPQDEGQEKGQVGGAAHALSQLQRLLLRGQQVEPLLADDALLKSTADGGARG